MMRRFDLGSDAISSTSKADLLRCGPGSSSATRRYATSRRDRSADGLLPSACRCSAGPSPSRPPARGRRPAASTRSPSGECCLLFLGKPFAAVELAHADGGRLILTGQGYTPADTVRFPAPGILAGRRPRAVPRLVEGEGGRHYHSAVMEMHANGMGVRPDRQQQGLALLRLLPSRPPSFSLRLSD